ncbi:hypothetical protein [Gloeocapsopsis sp. IPPAS B-1203]|uniref:hypothetical protein n=1 Tax=Gloeocapsopsis sp. IPPAS B-1203 TaxID=2049454 RepID=UPI000C1A555B|nr:hypothetical protein [Gloeocapsopsis sp. IPPAS B-1203]PIG95286.1 hypothetical protein CSQ79_02200 [Gloeocapsopsis sp. IPPAS B-1203]
MDKYQNSSRKRFQQIITWASIVAFLGSTLYGAISTINHALTQPSPNAAVSPESQRQAQAQGYEVVLQREPENQAALEGLALTRLQMNSANAAIAPLEKLVKLYPERQDYKSMLEQIKQQGE